MAKKLPAFQFYPGDWMKDPNLRRCSPAARGVWMDMICLSFECEDRGVFQTGGEPWLDEDIAAAVGGDTSEVLACIRELLRKGVAYRSEAGAVLCKRVVRDEQIRRDRSKAGSRGAKKGWSAKRQQTPSKTPAKRQQNPEGEGEEESSGNGELQEGKGNLPDGDSWIDGEGVRGFDGSEPEHWPGHWVGEIVSAHPRPGRRGGAMQAVQRALAEISHRFDTPNKAVDWLADRTRAFAASPAGKSGGRFVPTAKTWFEEGGYDQDDSEWQTGGDGKNGDRPPVVLEDHYE